MYAEFKKNRRYRYLIIPSLNIFWAYIIQYIIMQMKRICFDLLLQKINDLNFKHYSDNRPNIDIE